MKKKFLLILLLTCIISGNLSAQNFFPVSTGNKYLFQRDYQDNCAPWNDKITYYNYTVSDSIQLNGEIYYKYNIGGYIKYLLYDSSEQKLYIYWGNQKELAADFNLENGDEFYSYLFGYNFTSLGISYKNIFGGNRLCWSMEYVYLEPGTDYDYYFLEFVDGVGLYEYSYTGFCDPWDDTTYREDYTIFSAIINNQNFNPINLSVYLLTPIGDKRLEEFPLSIQISIGHQLPVFIDSLCLYYEVVRDSSIIFQHKTKFNPTYLTALINLDSTILSVGDQVKLRIVATDSTIFENRTTLPDTGYYSIKVLPDEISLQLYPLSIGNKWIYDGTFWDQTENYTYKFVRKVNDFVSKPNGLYYYEIEEYRLGSPENSIFYERIDSLEGKVYRYSEDSSQSNYEYLIDDLNASVGDSIMSYRFLTQAPYIMTNEGDTTIFQMLSHYKVFDSNYLIEFQYTLAQKFGLISVYNYFDFGSDIKLLKGAVINNITYGDTTLTGLTEKGPINLKYELLQNYPNPFNPITTIKYSISKTGTSGYNLVQLKVYDVLGTEVATLVNEEKPAGSYTVEFDGSKLSSSIYFYQLKAGEFTATKKLILLK